MLRSGARPGDDLYVSGTLGDARLALESFRGTVALDEASFRAGRAGRWKCLRRGSLWASPCAAWRRAPSTSPTAWSATSATSCARSGAGAVVDVDALPRSAVLAAQPLALQRQCVLAGGDDYELVFSAPVERRAAVVAAAAGAGVAVTRIGAIESGTALRLVDRQRRRVASDARSFDHFRA